MKTEKGQLTITHEDFETLNNYVSGLIFIDGLDRMNAAQLKMELRRAKLVKARELPDDVVRLNSRVTVKDGSKEKLIELVLVLPEKADIKQRRISVFAPIGTALIGFRKGDRVKWEVPAGKKTFTIMEVQNQNELL